MAIERGRFGIEYIRRKQDNDAHWLGRIVILILAVALVSFVWSLFGKIRARRSEDALVAQMTDPDGGSAPPPPRESVIEDAPPPPVPVAVNDRSRPKLVRSLLMRLEEARRMKDLEMEISTLEQLHDLPDGAAADLEPHIAMRLSDLNWRRLFVGRNAQWVSEYTVRSGDGAGRIATEHGSTLASFRKLNEGTDLNRLKIGQKVVVMDHPRFTLVVRKGMRSLDLRLNGRFFKRYSLLADVTAAEGRVEPVGRIRDFTSANGIALSESDRAELEMLIPLKAVAEITAH